MMKSTELVSKAIDIAENYKTAYIWGGLGRPITDEYLNNSISQYPNQNRRFAQVARRYTNRDDAFMFDCVGLIKCILWGWCGDHTHYMGGAYYGSNGVPDKSADGMIAACPDATDDFSSIEPGEVVWLPGHIGIYIGGDQAVECTPAFDNGVQISYVQNLGGDEYPCRTWQKHGRLPWVEYTGKAYDPIQADIDRLPGWAAPTVQKLYDRGTLKGNGQGLGLSDDVIQLLVILDREHIFEKEKE